MVAVPFEVLVCVSGLPIYFCLQASIILWFDQCVQEWYGPIIPGVFNCELDVAVKRVYMMEKTLLCMLFPR